MEDDFDYREILGDLEKWDEYAEFAEAAMEESMVNSWTLVHKHKFFMVFADYKGETRTVNANYIDNLFA